MSRRRIVEHAIPYFRARVATQAAFPDDQEIYDWAVKSWYDGLQELIDTGGYVGLTPPVDDEVMLVRRISFLRTTYMSSTFADQSKRITAPQSCQGTRWRCCRTFLSLEDEW
jgi:hypothetical protein